MRLLGLHELLETYGVINRPLMDVERQQVADKIVHALLVLSPADRAEVWSKVTYNGIFCVHCGYGSRKEPNAHCQCENDE